MRCSRQITLALGLFFTTAVFCQKPMPGDAQPTFEVVTVKPTPSDERNQGFDMQGRHVKLTRQTVLSMIMFAYGIHGKQIVDAPDWVRSEAYNVDGVPDVEGEPSFPQFQTLVKQLLADRFGLKTRDAKRELSYYALRVAGGGTKIASSASLTDAMPHQSGSGGPKGQTMKFGNNSMADFALGMQYFADRPVVNETGLTGRYDFTLQWTPDTMKVPENDAAPGLFTAMREQLGLELKLVKGPVDVMEVTAATKPGEN